MPLCNVSPIQSWSSFNKLVCFHFYLLLASVSQHWMLAPATVMSSCQTPNQSQRKPPTNLLLMSRKILWTQNLFLSQVQGGKRVKKSLKIYLYWKVCKSFWFFFLIITYLIILDPGFFDGIKSFNPHGQRITLEDAVVRACYKFMFRSCVHIFQRNWKPCAGVLPRFAPHQAGCGDWGSMRPKSPRLTGCTWRRGHPSRSWWLFKHCSSSTFSSPMLTLQNYKMLRTQTIDHRPTPMCRFIWTNSIGRFFSSYFPWHNLFCRSYDFMRPPAARQRELCAHAIVELLWKVKPRSFKRGFGKDLCVGVPHFHLYLPWVNTCSALCLLRDCEIFVWSSTYSHDL